VVQVLARGLHASRITDFGRPTNTLWVPDFSQNHKYSVSATQLH